MKEKKMERAVAIKKLGKLLGKKMAYRVDPNARGQEERDAARAELTPALEQRNALDKQLEERRAAILAADQDYQRLKAERKEAAERVDKLGAITRHYKFTVGTIEGIAGIGFFHTRAEGDSWEQVIDKLTPKTKVAA